MSHSNNPIGIFDSGLGGLSILNEIRQLLPYESLIFYGDSLNCPYGPKSKETIISLSEKITNFLLHQKCKVIVVACNTATAAAIQHLRRKYNIEFIGIEPAVKPAAINSKTKVIGVLATEGTFNGDHYKNTSGKFADEVNIITKIGHHLVDIVEENKINEKFTEEVLMTSLKPMIENNVDHIVLGCTHYPFLIPIIKRLIPKNINIINPAPAVALRTKEILKSLNLLNKDFNALPSYKFYTSHNLKNLKSFVLAQFDFSDEQYEFQYNPL